MHPIENIMQTAMAEIKEMVDVNTIVGDPIIGADGSTIIPISKVSFGFMSGGGEYGKSDESSFPFAGGASGGISIHPIGFLVVDENNVQLLSVNGKNTFESLLQSVPQLVADLKSALDKRKEEH